MKAIKHTLLPLSIISLSVLLAGCGGSSNSSNNVAPYVSVTSNPSQDYFAIGDTITYTFNIQNPLQKNFSTSSENVVPVTNISLNFGGNWQGYADVINNSCQNKTLPVGSSCQVVVKRSNQLVSGSYINSITSFNAGFFWVSSVEQATLTPNNQIDMHIYNSRIESLATGFPSNTNPMPINQQGGNTLIFYTGSSNPKTFTINPISKNSSFNLITDFTPETNLATRIPACDITSTSNLLTISNPNAENSPYCYTQLKENNTGPVNATDDFTIESNTGSQTKVTLQTGSTQSIGPFMTVKAPS